MERLQLENGIDLWLDSVKNSSSVMVQFSVGSGSLNEEDHQAGMAHLLEHMVFKCSKMGEATDDLTSRLERVGLAVNAYTSFSHTVFHASGPSDQAYTAIDGLAGAIFEFDFSETDLAAEIEVVLEEIKRGLDNPARILSRRVLECHYRGSRAALPIIGRPDQVSSYRKPDVMAFYERCYHPANVSVAIVGGGEFMPLIERLNSIPSSVQSIIGGPLESAPTHKMECQPSPVLRTQPEINLIYGQFSQPKVQLVFDGVKNHEADSIRLDLLSFFLSGGDTGKLTKDLVEKSAAFTSLVTSSYSPDFRGFFSILAVPILESFHQSFRQLLQKIVELRGGNWLTSKDLQRAKNTLKVDKYLTKMTTAGRGASVGHAMVVPYGEYYEDIISLILDRLQNTDIEKLANNYLDLNRVLVVCLLPEHCKESITDDSIEQLLLEFNREDEPERKPENLNVRSSRVAHPKPEILHSRDGLKVIYQQTRDTGIFTLTAVTEGGQRMECNPILPGFFNAISHLVARSNQFQTSETLSQMVEFRGAEFHGFSGKDTLGLSLQGLDEHRSELLETLVRCVDSPAFDDSLWKVSRSQIIDEIESQSDSHALVAMDEFRKEIYGSHPYALPITGTKNTLARFEVLLLQQQYRQFWESGPWVISASGPSRAEDFLEDLMSKVASWGLKQKRSTGSGKVWNEKIESPRLADREQVHLIAGYPGVSWSDGSRYAMDILGVIMGGASGRLFRNLREKRSLAYSVSPVVSYGIDAGLFGLYLGCSADKESAAKEALFEELLNLENIEEKELDRAKQCIVANHAQEIEHADHVVMSVALMELYGLGHFEFYNYIDKIKQVQLNDLLDLVRQLKSKSKPVFVSTASYWG